MSAKQKMKTEEKHAFLIKVISFIDKEIDPEALEYFVGGTTEKRISKNEVCISTNLIHDEIGFVCKGLLRGFYLDTTGREINTRFVGEGNFATHYKAFISREPSKYTFKAVEQTELLCISYDHIQRSFKLFQGIERFGRLMAENIIKRMDSRLESQQFDDAKKRYYDFMKEYPDLHNRLSLEQIASYLRVTRPALSRIRGQKS